MKKIFSCIFLAFSLLCSTFALEFSFKLAPSLLFPVVGKYSLGFGGYAQADLDLFGFLTLGVEGNFMGATANGFDNMLTSYGGGAGAGVYYYPLSRLYLGAGASGGIYNFSSKVKKPDSNEMETRTAGGYYYRGYAEVGFRINPTVTLNLTGGYASYNVVNKTSPLVAGPYAGISAKITVPVGKSKTSGIRVTVNQEGEAFPLFMSAYRTCPLATLTIRNLEGAELKDVHVSFRAGKYTASTFESAVIPRINKHASIEIPLYADFNTEILKFSENGKISGEVVIDYSFLGKKMQAVQNVVLSVNNRNAFVWADSTALCAFISPDTPEVLEFAKYVAGIARNGFKTGLNRNLETTAAMFEALRIAGVEYTNDMQTPYGEYHLNGMMDSIQYPLQTMNMLGGDIDDIGILLVSCLESVGVPTAFLITDDDFIVLVNMNIKPSSAGNHFADVSKIIVDDETAYFGLSMKNFEKGFNESMKAAGTVIQMANNGEDVNYEYVDTHYAWDYYAPAVFTGSSGLFKNPSQSQIEKVYTAIIDSYLDTEIAGVIENARKTGDPNKIGLALVRVGRYADAKKEFQKSDTVQAMNNLANVLILEKDFDGAIAQFNKVLEKDPENATALKGINKANSMKIVQ